MSTKSEPVAVLVVPTASDPGGLLAPGRCGGSAPRVARTDHGTWYENSGPTWALALPLWWDGALVPEGWDRARRVLYATGRVAAQGVQSPDHEEAATVCRLLVAVGLASRTVLLDRVDGRLVERS